jgi:hypothetical protein
MRQFTANNPNRADGSGGDEIEDYVIQRPYSRITVNNFSIPVAENDSSTFGVENSPVVRDDLHKSMKRKPPLDEGKITSFPKIER